MTPGNARCSAFKPSATRELSNLKTPRKILFLALLVCSLAGIAAAKAWRITDFQDSITVNTNGSALVNERITLAFEGEFHGIHRTIPIEYPGPNGTNYELFIEG